MATTVRWCKVLAHIHHEMLERFLAAIRQTHEDVVEKIDAEAETAGADTPQEYFDGLNEERALTNDVIRAMYATLAVATFAFVESSVDSTNRDFGATYIDKKGKKIKRPNWHHRRQAFDEHFGTNCDKFSGFATVNRVRIIANCYKHNNGLKDDEAVKVLRGRKGDEIRYEDENWTQHLTRVRKFVDRVVVRRGAP